MQVVLPQPAIERGGAFSACNVAMAAPVDLSVLSKSSAKLATFAVALHGGRVFEYSYDQKKDGKRITAHRFEVYLVGLKGESYCIGFLKDSQQQCEKAKAQYKDGSTWLLSKVVLDTYTSSNYIATPVPFRVDLRKSTLKTMAGVSGAPQPALHPIPPRSVADVAGINTARSTDLLAFIKTIGAERTTTTGYHIADVELLDDSKIGEELAIVTVSVFGKDKLNVLKEHLGSPMVFFNLSVQCSQGNTKISHFANDVVVQAPECDKTTHLTTQKNELATAVNVKSLTTGFTPNASKDVSGPQVLSCAAFLDYTRDNPHATLPATHVGARRRTGVQPIHSGCFSASDLVLGAAPRRERCNDSRDAGASGLAVGILCFFSTIPSEACGQQPQHASAMPRAPLPQHETD